MSVVICGIPREGFDYLRKLSGSRDKDIAWMVRENLKKNRLTGGFAKEVKSIRSGTPLRSDYTQESSDGGLRVILRSCDTTIPNSLTGFDLPSNSWRSILVVARIASSLSE